MNCIIIDDDTFYIEFLKNYCKKVNIEVKAVYQNSVVALQEISKLSDCDVVFLDIHMPDISGFDILKNKPNTQIVILSADDANAIKAFDYNVVDYLQKPFEFERFMRAINRVQERIKPDAATEQQIPVEEKETSTNQDISSIFVNVNKKLIKLNIEDIYAVEAKGDYVLIKLDDKDNLIVHSTLKRIKEKLPLHIFTQVHRSFLVNLKKIVDIEDSTIVVNRDVIPISKSNRASLMAKLDILN
ncbi:MAG: response regulator [Lutibacter sp.]|uniref:LytR/AlgR family response regulator transcription factor n=1 Tax=Lutibacter sp. TaxID=1925666 RepID=UPI0019E4E389|nr:LytTR family DNA-binding domain-containing protein [Lutibacter sp.]NOR26953.1 response regulator [Lutibacter sp.]